jgi:hypothetical protein
MHEFAINQVQVVDVQTIDNNLQPTITKRVSFYVDKQGPFILFYKPSDYSADKVKQDMQHQVTTLQAIIGGAS